MFCPFKMTSPELESHYDTHEASYTSTDWECARSSCALWNERFGQCSLAVDAYLKGQEDCLKERGMKD